jgi:antitoxin (DNA-binding transcriptional repressor) of toxin-antitoxin stability system
MAVKSAVSTIDVRDFEEQMRVVLQRVKEGGEVIDVTDGDSVVARLVPVETPVDHEALAAWWKHHDELVDEINQHWPEGVSVADAIADIRRDL